MIPDGFKPFSVDLDPDDEGRVFSFIMLDKSHELAQEMCARINAGSIAEPGATPLEAIISESPDGLITEWDSDNYPERIVELRDKADAYDKQAAELSQLRSELAEAQKQRDLWRSVCENDTENEDVCLKLLERFDEKNPEYPTGLVERVELAMKKLTASESARRVLVEEVRASRSPGGGLHSVSSRLKNARAAVDSLKLLEGEG